MNKYLELGFALLQIVVTVIALIAMFQPKRYISFLFSFLLVYIAFFAIVDFFAMPVWFRAISSLFINLIIIFVFTRANLFKICMGYAIIFVASGVCEVIMQLGMKLLEDKIGNIYEDTTNYILVNVLMLFLVSLVYILIINLWRIYVQRLPDNNMYLFSLIPISQMFALIFVMVYSFNEEHIIGFSVAAFLLMLFVIADVVMFNTMKQVRENDELRRTNELIAVQLRLQYEHYEKIAANTERVRMLRHDLANHFQTLRSYLAREEIAAADALIDDYASNLLKASDDFYCKNRIIDALLINKAELAQQSGIKLNINVTVLEQSSFDNLDLCSVFSNLLDNAIRACSEIRTPGLAKHIELDSYYKGGYFIVRCHNSKDNTIVKSKDGRIQSDKPHTQSTDGLGLTILDNIAQKYDGECKIEYDEHNFQVIVYLALSELT